eukprot:46365-Lingulodinium_polyedra.AAC.1
MPKAKSPAASNGGATAKRALPPGTREAQRGDFPKLIPFHAGPHAMFAVSMRKGQEGWAKCT